MHDMETSQSCAYNEEENELSRDAQKKATTKKEATAAWTSSCSLDFHFGIGLIDAHHFSTAIPPSAPLSSAQGHCCFTSGIAGTGLPIAASSCRV